MIPLQKKQLGSILIDSGLITSEQLEKALLEQKRTGVRLGRILINRGYTTEENIIEALGRQLRIPIVDLSNYLIEPEIVNLIPENIARHYQVIAIAKDENKIKVAMADPLNIFAIDEIRRHTGLEVEPVITTEAGVRQAIDQSYGISGSVEEVIKSIDLRTLGLLEEEMPQDRLQKIVEETPIIKLVNLMVMQALRDRASDIHIEPDYKELRIRYRIDGVLHEMMSPPKNLHSAIVSRVKIMADLDIAEKRIPQDGRIEMRVENREIDIRVATLPTIHGEKVALRLLDKASILLGLDQLGLARENLNTLKRLITKPVGIILVTGPTNSGKTTTLYAALNKINSMEKNIVTIEDPVECPLRLVNQVQINPKAGVTFATGLRSIIRQDPDIIMVGEIRDLETAEIAIHAALTGHLVFSTLHTNDAPGAVTRLIDMGVEPFLVSSALTGVVAQRLVRTICSRCKETYVPKKKILEEVGLLLEGSEKQDIVLSRGRGCPECKQTGYRGRTGIFELITMNEEIRGLIVSKAPTSVLRQAAIKAGMKTLREDGLEKVLKGITTIEEVLRVTQEEEI